MSQKTHQLTGNQCLLQQIQEQVAFVITTHRCVAGSLTCGNILRTVGEQEKGVDFLQVLVQLLQLGVGLLHDTVDVRE